MSVTLREFLEVELQKNQDSFENIEALAISNKYQRDGIRCLADSEEIKKVLDEEHYDFPSIPRFVMWTTKRIYFLTIHNAGPAYDGDECQFEHEISSISRNPSAELIQSEY